ncbi:unnamed protein product [Caenorhabditis sp. 36 PRJEB53466]|nr:unnamed protein product [Caenorhabditis sp. 36 PRJEB53466]
MSFYSTFFLVLVGCSSLALCQTEVKKGGHPGHFIMGPTYLANLTKEEKDVYFGIYRDKNLTIKQQEEKRLAFAHDHGFESVLKEELKRKEDSQAVIIKERPAVLKYIQEANEALAKVYQNKDQTVGQQQKAVEALKEKYPHAVPALFYLSRLITGKGIHQPQEASNSK